MGAKLPKPVVDTELESVSIGYIRKHFPKKTFTLWIGAIDDELTVKSYIVHNLDDVGDLAYGRKMG